ncbi:CO/xanthine dehydrogenase Mo-binding subunit [Palleronia aestuarii]|uniref:CO/xanthine dehydrogenase Mo-binding subunit n=1 Tax=Palleronia aestuarii TaxID=568105 RepID=A0A2W7P492_9RHOB|nr:molybdopterin cofactor-binding domain-containing protein [Palleronia aestuarii]PZX18222.1 CO/xanthine dehydrogenase Mo-binding subunit [Palleronia aestuarii]
MTEHLRLTRRGFVGAAGSGLVVAFSMARADAQAGGEADVTSTEGLPGSLGDISQLDSWIRIDPEGAITVFTGKAELGQGIKTALLLVAAEELGVAPGELEIVSADTALTPDEGYTAASHSMEESGMAIRVAAANVYLLLLEAAAERLGADISELEARDGEIRGPGGTLSYGALAGSLDLAVAARPDVPLRDPSDFSVMGGEMTRIDIPPKVTGQPIFVQDLRPEGMVHARIVRPPSPGATLTAPNADDVETMPGVVTVVRDGNFLAVVAEREWQAIQAMRALEDAAEWETPATLPRQSDIHAWQRDNVSEVGTVDAAGTPEVGEARSVRMTFTRPYTLHGSIGPSCAVAVMEGEDLHVWSHTQGVYPDRAAIAEMLGMEPDRVRVSHVQGSGCYGHNGADDAAADAALVARAVPGRPVRVQWMREQEHAWEPFGPVMSMDVAGQVDEEGRITDWTYDLWSGSHVARPGGANKLLAANHLADPFPFELPDLQIVPPGLGDRNAVPLYQIPNKRILWHFVKPMPMRTSALRALGAHANIFALESFVDELALVAETDPVEFRLRHLQDQRDRDVIERAATEFGWSQDPLPRNEGRGFAFARYKNLAAYCALAMRITVEPETGRVRVHDVVAAVDSGEAVHPDGIRNQTEGGIVQSLSWTLFEEIVFDETRVTSIDWSSYPIMRFGSVPERIDVHVMDRPGDPFLGTGEAAQGPTAAALGNAIRSATGVRMKDLPLSPDRLAATLGV